MKRKSLAAAVLAVLAVAPFLLTGAFTNPAANINYRSIKWQQEGGTLDLWLDETEDYLDGTTAVPNGHKLGTVFWQKTDTAPTTAEGWMYFDDSENCPKYYNGSGWVALTTGTGDNTLDNAYDQGGAGAGKAITADTGAVAISNTDADAAFLLTLDASPSAPAASGGLQITVGANSTQDALEFVNGGSGYDIYGTSGTWTADKAGALTGASLTLTGAIDTGGTMVLQNDGTIANSTDTEIAFGENSEDVVWDFQNNLLLWKTTTDVASVNWGDLDAHTGLNTLAFDAAASSISLASDGAAQDLTIAVTGAQNSSLILSSAGTGADALQILASAGGIDITSDTGGDIDILATSKSVTITATEAAADAIVLNASTALGGIDITSNHDIDITTTGAAGEDITITNTGGSVSITATENDADAITIATSGGGGASESINILVDQGTADDSIDIDSTAGGMDIDVGKSFTVTSTEGSADSIYLLSTNGGIDITAATNGDAEDLDIGLTGNTNSSILITSAGNGTDALSLSTTANSGDIVINSHDKIDMDSTGTFALNAAGDTLLIQVDSDGAADDLSLIVDGDDDSSIILDSDGTGADAIKINASNAAGGIDIDAGTNGIGILATGGNVSIASTKNVASAVALTSNGGTDETIVVTNTQGNTAAAISLIASAGGITLNGASGGVVFTTGQTRKVLIPVSTVTLDGTNPPTLAANGTDAQWKGPSLEFDADGGATGDDICFIHWVVPDGYKVDTAKLNVYWSFDSAEDLADECVFDAAVNAVGEGETLDAAGTALDAVTTVVADASTSAGKIFKDQINIEVEDIAVGDLVSIKFWVDEDASLMAASGTCDIHYFEIEYESTE